jgi:transcriptional regulator with XRE-family HTH domain
VTWFNSRLKVGWNDILKYEKKMIVRKLRLKKGWSQEQLAEFTDLSVRTIQRAERGQKPSLETARSLASVFEVGISTFNRGINTMNPIDQYKETNQESETENYTQAPKEELKDDEKQAIEYVKGIKEFYTHLFLYVVFVVTILIFKSNFESRLLLPFAGWGIGVIAHGLIAFEVIGLKWHKWEKKQIEKKLGRKL